jgi:hypothetical protein
MHFYYISSLDDINTAASPGIATDPSIGKVVKVLYPASLFYEGLTSPSSVSTTGTKEQASQSISVDPFIKRPIDFVLNIFRSLQYKVSDKVEDETMVDAGSQSLPRSAASVPGKNFFARWLKMTGFNRRWAAMPILEDEGEEGCFPIVKAAQDTATLPALQKQMGDSVGNAGSAWQLLQQVLGHMYMEICAIPAPPAALTSKVQGKVTRRGNLDGMKGSGAVASIPTFYVKPMCTFALPPSCNVIFPGMIENYSYQENYIRQPTRLYLSEQFISNVIAPGPSQPMNNLLQNLMVTGYPEAVRKRMKDLLEASPETTNKNFLLFKEEFFKGPVSRRLNAPPWMYLLQQRDNANTGPQTQTQKEIAAHVKDSVTDEVTSSLGVLFDTYAKSEYYRSRYAERSGGVNLAWNPYIVPGFPVVVFDQENAGFDTIGYANTITHTMSAKGTGNMSTVVNLTFMRTMPEFVGLMDDADSSLDINPPEVIPEISDAFQHTKVAHDLYKRMLYSGAPMSKSAVFDWRKMMYGVNKWGDTISFNKDVWRLDPSITLKPHGEYKGLFEGYDAAMQYASRPVCTLQQYIETWHGKSLKTLLENGTVRGEYTSFYSPIKDRKQTKGAVFWGRIYTLLKGPGNTPDTKYTNMGSAPDYNSAGDAGWDIADPTNGMPQTRDDWDKILEEYRKIVRSEFGKIAPQV